MNFKAMDYRGQEAVTLGISDRVKGGKGGTRRVREVASWEGLWTPEARSEFLPRAPEFWGSFMNLFCYRFNDVFQKFICGSPHSISLLLFGKKVADVVSADEVIPKQGGP